MNINEENFNEEVLNTKGLVLVDFWAPWCGPCMMLGPIIEEVSEETGTKLCKINVDQNENLAIKYNIDTIPRVMLFKDGTLVEEKQGLCYKDELLNMIKRW